MTFFRFPEFLLFFLLPQVYSEEVEPVFKAEGSDIELGYCFGVDYIVVFRSTPEGDQLLGNSSAHSTPMTPPAALRGRISINKNEHLLGLQISQLTRMDSGIYRRECWQNHTLYSQHLQKLSVCDEEVESKEIIVKEKGVELLCNSTSFGLEGTSVRWYHEIYPSYRITLLLDSNESLEPLVEELQGVVEVRDSGALLLLNHSMLKPNQHFYCLVIKDTHCLSFQDIYISDVGYRRDIFASHGDRVVLECPSDGNNQQWETPLGTFDGSNETNYHMNIACIDKSEDFSLVIPAVTEDYSGDYSCMSSSLFIHYSLVLCLKMESQENGIFLGEVVLLDCDVGEGDSQWVQWYRQNPSGEYELIFDTNDETVAIPQDLRDRLTPSENGFSLTISNLEVRDIGGYWCVVSEGPRFLEEHEYTDDYGGEDEHSGDVMFQFLQDTHRCLSKQEIILSLINKTRRDLDFEPVTLESVTRNLEMNITTDRSAPAASNVKAYAVGAGLVGLLVVGLIVLAILIKRRAIASCSGPNSTDDINMTVDPECTKRLTHNNE